MRFLVVKTGFNSSRTRGSSYNAFQVQSNYVKSDVNTVNDNLNHPIYCKGSLIEAVMSHKLFNDSKTFTELPLRYSPSRILENFEEKFPSKESITRSELAKFVQSNFYGPEMLEPGKSMELTVCTPSDWTPLPHSILRIPDQTSRDFALALHQKWPDLCRFVNRDVASADKFSLIYLEHPFVVPGGRFREVYYWDSFWTIKGLLMSEMFETVKSMLINFADLIRIYGFIPNGGRIYYLNRSQPPMFIMMIKEYIDKTNDFQFLAEMIPFMEKELLFWNNHRKTSVEINGITHEVFQYNVDSESPRPESFREDVNLVNDKSLEEKQKIWRNLASAAESGWDFSSRWLQNPHDLSSIETTNYLPLDLNSILCGSTKILAGFYEKLGLNDSSEAMMNNYSRLQKTIASVFHDKESGVFCDYNLRTKSHTKPFYLSSFAPFFAKCLEEEEYDKGLRSTYRRMEKEGMLRYPGGIPASMVQSREQWDFPNAWPPLMHMVNESLRLSNDKDLQSAGFEIAQKWVNYNFETFNEYGTMFEKYEVTGKCKAGVGGEYTVQQGFGWTNGVILDLVSVYKDQLILQPKVKESESSENKLQLELKNYAKILSQSGSNSLFSNFLLNFFRLL